MKNSVEKVFNIIGIQPNEPFFFKYETDKNLYYINEALHIKSCKNDSISKDYTIRELLMNPTSIETKNSIEAKIETIFKFLGEIYNFHYLTQDKNGEIYVFTEKPIKKLEWSEWVPEYDDDALKELDNELIPGDLIDHIAALISWEDEEPLDMRKPVSYPPQG